MKVLHFSDLHIGYERYSKTTDLKTGLDDRIIDFLNVFDETSTQQIDRKLASNEAKTLFTRPFKGVYKPLLKGFNNGF